MFSSFRWVAQSTGTMTIVDQSLVSCGNFLTSVIIGRACSKEELGFYMLGFTLMLFSAGVQQALILSPYIVFSARCSGRELRRYTGSSFLQQIALCGVTVAVLLVAAVVLYFAHSSRRLDTIVWALAAAVPFMLVKEFARQLSFARLQVKTALVLDCSLLFAQVSGLLVLARFGLLSASRAYYLSGAACAAISLIWFLCTRRLFAFSSARVFADFRQNWRLGKWLFASSVSRAGSAQMYPWILTAFHGVAATGVLAACRGIIFAANPFLIGLHNFLAPKSAHEFHKSGPHGLYRVVSQAMFVIAVVMGVFCLAMLWFGDSALKIVYGSKYAGHGAVIGVLAVGQLVSAITIPLTSGLLAIERSDVEFKSCLAAVAVMFTVGIWLVRGHAALGVACGLLVGNMASLIVGWVVFQRERRAVRMVVAKDLSCETNS